jgi:triosephosphate isomerase
MHKKSIIKPPFFEIGPKNYLFGDQILELALAADKASEKYDVDIIFTTPYVDIRTVSEKTKKIHVFAPHMDCVSAGRGLANILPESLKAAGAKGVMLNHAEKPLEYSRLADTVKRAKELELISIVCANSIDEAKAVALLNPEIIVAEPTELIGTGKSADVAYVRDACNAVRSINPEIYVLIAAGINDGKDVYNVIYAGADASGSSSGIVKAADPILMVDEMVGAVRQAWNDRNNKKEFTKNEGLAEFSYNIK